MNIIKTLLASGVLATFAGLASAGNISLSVSGEVSPGVYGRVDVGPTRPVLVYEQPVIITRPVRVVSAPPPPLYLAVPPGHAKHWSKHCGRYNACARQVYFVRSSEYAPVYVDRGQYRDHDRYEERHDGHGKGKDKEKEKGKGKGHGRGHDKH
ncbi:MAG: hypothetical protein ABIX46_14450 [Burkholderiaceae bacterium]